FYRLGEASGTAAADASGNGLTATYVGGPTLGAVGSPVGGSDTAVQLNGTGQYIQMPNGFADFTSGLTLEIWANPTAVSNGARFFDLGNGPYAENIILYRSGTTNDLRFAIYRGGSVVTDVTAPNAIQLNSWQHFAVTMDVAGTVKLFKNGQVIATGN